MERDGEMVGLKRCENSWMESDWKMVGSRDGKIGGWRDMGKQLNRKRWGKSGIKGKCQNGWIVEEKIVLSKEILTLLH